MAITLADFNKIWASTSPLTPYSFSEANYKRGWNFIGATPPARQMWDSYMKASDEKAQWLYNNKLSLSGGAMTGNVRWNMPNAETRLFRTDETGKLALYGGVNWNTSANLYLNGNASNNPGQFILTANNGVNPKALIGKPDGTLTWGGVSVIVGTEVSETFADVSVPANDSVKVGELSGVARHWSCFVTGTGLASVYVTMSVDKKSVYAYNVTSTARTLSFTVNYIV